MIASPQNKRFEGQARPARAAFTTAAWIVLCVFATLIGVVSLRYALPRIPHPAALPNFTTNRHALVTHAISASIALLIGPWQFLKGLRARRPRLHRYLGRVYAASLLTAAVSALWIAPHAYGGAESTWGFGLLAVGWLITTSLGIIDIRRRRVSQHREWMIRSYALTAAAITLRIYLVAIPLFHLQPATAYPAISWLCWVPTLIAAELWIRWTRRPSEKNASSFELQPRWEQHRSA